MKKFITSTVLGFTALVGVGSALAGTTSPQQGSPKMESSVRYWMHPKLGMVRVDPVTLAMLHPVRRTERTAPNAGEQGK